MNLGKFVSMIKEAGLSFYEHNAFRFGASLAYYTVVSLAPLIIIALSVASLIFERHTVQTMMLSEMRDMIGEEGAKGIQNVIQNAQQQSGILATVLGIIAFAVGYTAVFFELQTALNTLWGVKAQPQQNVTSAVRKYALAFALAGVIGFLLLVSLVVSTVLSALGQVLQNWQPELYILWNIVNFIFSFVVIFLLFAILFKYIPDVEIAWNDVWIGAAITTALFAIGKFLIGMYLGQSSISSSYGAAGSIVVILVWVYYSAQILFFGAELTQVYANRYGSRIVPSPHAVPRDEEAAAKMASNKRSA